MSNNTADQQVVPTLATSTIQEFETATEFLVVDEPEALLCAWLDASAALLARAKRMRERIEDIAVRWIDANGPVEIGDILYTVGNAKAVKCVDTLKCLATVLQSCHGELDAVVDYLRSDPWKYGAIRGLVGEAAFEELFKTEFKSKLVEGKPRPELIATNKRFAALPRTPPCLERISDRAK